MTDLFGSLLDRMSSVFNDARINTPINIQEDNTLKWKSLINNNFAKKEKEKEKEKKMKGTSSSASGNSSEVDSPEDDKKNDESLTQAISNVTNHLIIPSGLKEEANIDENFLLIADNQCSGGSFIIATPTDDDLKREKLAIDDDNFITDIAQSSSSLSLALQQAKSDVPDEIMLSTDDGDGANELGLELGDVEKIETNQETEKCSVSQSDKPMLPSTIETTTPIHTPEMADNNNSTNEENLINACDGSNSDDKKITKLKNGNLPIVVTPTAAPSVSNPNTSNNNNNKTIDKTKNVPSDRNLRSNKTTSTATNTTTLTPTPTQSGASDDKKLDELEENDNGDSNSNSSQSTLKKGRGRPKLDSRLSESPAKAKEPSENDSQQKRGRGRVTRRAADSAVDEKVDDPEGTDEKKVDFSTSVDIKKEEDVPKRRGRSRKLIEESQQPPVEIPGVETSKPDESAVETSTIADEIKKEETPELQKKKRGRTKKLASETDDPNKGNVSSQGEESKPRLILTIRTEKSVSKIISPSANAQPLSPKEDSPVKETESEVKVVRRRGRRARPAQVKKSPRNLARESGESVLKSAIARKEKINENPPLRNRSLRRIKPTAKILENEELRQGFEIQNCVRLSISNENLENLERSSPSKVPDAHHHVPHENKHNDKREHHATSKMEPPKPVKSVPEMTCAQKSTTQQNQSLQTTNLIIDNIYPKPSSKPCRSPEEFLKEIKDAKIGLHRSAEDNKKLNKRQQRKLFKMKIKHLSMLGLRRASKHDDDDDSEDSMESESDAEEFVPTKFSKQDIAKPNITLRLRNQKSDKPSVMPSRKSGTTIKRRKVTDEDGVAEKDKRMKLANDANGDHSDDDCILIETNQTQSNFRNATNKENNHQNLICFCLQKTKYCVKQQQTLPFAIDGKIFCCAIDEIEKRKVGCTNELTEPLLNLYRPSVKVSYMLLCPNHKKRLITHNCCSGCGIFCSQGTFVVCSNKHFFHRECAIKYILNTPYDPNNPHFTEPTLVLKCPHCGVDAPHFDYRVSMRCENLPVFVPHRNPLPKPAKMSIQVHKQTHQSFLLNIEKLIPNSVILMLKNAYDKLQMRKNQPSSSTAPIDNSNLYSPKDFFYALYMKDGDEKVADIIASGFNLLTPFKEFHNGTCLHLVANFGTLTMTYLILCRANSHDFMDLMDKEMRTASMCAVVGGKNDILKLLCQCGADVTIKGPDGMTVLHLAAKVGNSEAVQIILEHYRQKATVQKLKQFIDTTDNGCWTALVWAAEHGHAGIVNYLMSLGADPNICDSENNTVAHWASLSGNLETMYPLLSNCDINIQNIHGDTALHIACRQSNARICLLLLANGGSITVKNAASETPYDCIPDQNGLCAKLVRFNMNLRSLGIGGWNANFGEKTILCNDVSNGREIYPIQIVKNFNPHSSGEETIIPDFKYINKNILLQNNIQIDQRISQMRVCNCSDNCISDNCQCGQISLQNWYNIDGRLISDFHYEDPPMLFECNDVCGCNRLMCKNRVVQNGIKLPLVVFECEDRQKGFGVKCLTKIVKGTFVSQYIGEILTDHEANRRTDDSYFFDLGASDHCIDANFYGNVSRFFNHSCEPNVVPVRVYFEHQDMRFPKIAFFASQDIEAGEEIAFDYGEKFWIVKYKFFTCLCKSPKCRYSTETINSTIEEYNQRASSSNVINID